MLRRTPLARKSPLTSRTKLPTRQEIQRSQAIQRPPRKTGPTKTVRELVLARAGERCERCGGGNLGSIHHRKPRGMGGTKDPAINSPANLMALCGTGTTGCHGWVESHRQDALAEGWLVPRTADPAEAPVRAWGVGWVKLLPNGHYQRWRAPQEENRG